MGKSSSESSRGKRPGGGTSANGSSSFKKEGGERPYSKSSRPQKKNYDGRGPSSDAAAGSSRSKPYSGRVTGSDGPKRSFDKPSFGKEGGERATGYAGRKPRNESDRPDNGDKPFGERKQRSFDKPAYKKEDRNAGGGTSRPFGERKPRSFDKPAYKKDDRAGSGEDRKPFSERPKRTFDKPAYKKDDRAGSGEDRKPFSERPKRTFDKPAYKKDDRAGSGEDRKPFSERPKRTFDKPAYKKEHSDSEGEERVPFSERPKRTYNKTDSKDGDAGSERRPRKSSDSRPFREREQSSAGKPAFDKKGPRKDSDKKGKGDKGPKRFSDVVNNVFNQPSAKEKMEKDEDHPGKREQFEDKVYGELEDAPEENRPKKPFEIKKNAAGKKKHIHDHSEGRKKKYKDEDEDFEEEDDKEINQKDGPRLEMPLNKFIAHSGECSRRDAAEVVRQGKVKVNGELVLDPGYRVQHDDKVTMSGKKLTPQKGMVYILLNKPKGFITTNDDPQGRKKVMDLVGNSGVERLFPVGRLDRDTSGLLLITNDGDLTQKLCHPAYNIKKVYQVTLDKALTKADFEKIIEGVELEDGKAVVDALSYLEKKNELGLEIHSGRNRIVRRIFESLGYVVDKLDRVMYAGLTKKNLPRSKWRYLDEREVVLLKHFKN